MQVFLRSVEEKAEAQRGSGTCTRSHSSGGTGTQIRVYSIACDTPADHRTGSKAGGLSHRRCLCLRTRMKSEPHLRPGGTLPYKNSEETSSPRGQVGKRTTLSTTPTSGPASPAPPPAPHRPEFSRVWFCGSASSPRPRSQSPRSTADRIALTLPPAIQ